VASRSARSLVFMSVPFDPTPYVRAPIITVSSGVTLALAVADACPAGAPVAVKKAQKRLWTTAEKARDDLAARNRALGVYSEEDSRALDNEADRCWGGLRMRLQALAMLPAARYPRARRAAELEAKLFGEGTEFLKAEYTVQGPAMAAILQRIDEDKLAAEVDALAGPDFLKALRDVQPRYEAMVSERLRRDKALGQNLLETTRALQAAIVNYATKLIATIDDEDPESVEAVRVALLPIDNFRKDAARPASSEEAGPEAEAGAAQPA
jgi:Family of unknown function (DUF6261)